MVLPILAAATLLHGEDPSPATSAAFDRYEKLIEDDIHFRETGPNFLWLEQHPKEKDLVWLGQSFVIPQETLDQGKKIEVPGGVIQHWLGAIYLDNTTVERVRDALLDYANYKGFLGQQIPDSRIDKREGDHFEVSLQLKKKKFTQVVLNMQLAATFQSPNPQRVYIESRSTKIGDAPYAIKKGASNNVLVVGEPDGSLWRMNLYWRLEQTVSGVYAELDLISLSRSSGMLHSGRYLNGFQDFPREFAEALIDGLHHLFPPPR